MKILSFDTTNNLASVAIIDNGKVISCGSTNENSQQAEKLFELINDAFRVSELELSDIDLISVTNGPGSFTGVRIGLSAALGMRMSFGKKIISLSNFQVLAWKARQKDAGKDIAVILDARRDQVYLQLFNEKLEELSEARLVKVSELVLPDNIVLIGSGVSLLPKNIDESLAINPNARILAESSEYYIKNKLHHDLVPLYIRQPDISKPKIIT